MELRAPTSGLRKGKYKYKYKYKYKDEDKERDEDKDDRMPLPTFHAEWVTEENYIFFLSMHGDNNVLCLQQETYFWTFFTS